MQHNLQKPNRLVRTLFRYARVLSAVVILYGFSGPWVVGCSQQRYTVDEPAPILSGFSILIGSLESSITFIAYFVPLGLLLIYSFVTLIKALFYPETLSSLRLFIFFFVGIIPFCILLQVFIQLLPYFMSGFWWTLGGVVLSMVLEGVALILEIPSSRSTSTHAPEKIQIE